jgi:hypothetical protein
LDKKERAFAHSDTEEFICLWECCIFFLMTNMHRISPNLMLSKTCCVEDRRTKSCIYLINIVLLNLLPSPPPPWPGI